MQAPNDLMHVPVKLQDSLVNNFLKRRTNCLGFKECTIKITSRSRCAIAVRASITWPKTVDSVSLALSMHGNRNSKAV